MKLTSMKKLKYICLSIIFSVFITDLAFSQAAKNNLILGLGYFNDNNQQQYLKANTKTKINGKFQPVAGIGLRFYINSESADNLLGKTVTNEKGQANMLISAAAKDEWNKSRKHSFLAISDSSGLYDAVQTSFDLTKARIKIDTAADRNITAVITEYKDSLWTPVKGVDLKIAVKRLGGDLNVSETPSYTTDSLGAISAEFKRNDLPGDSAGNLIIIAKVEDNDVYGNLTTEKSVPWGKPTQYISEFNKRSLFARRGWSPLWLEWMAYSVIALVWGVLVYLFLQIRKLKRLGA